MPRYGIWKGLISFGLLNIPVYLKSATEDKDLHFSMLDEKNLSPIRYKKFNAKTNQEVPFERIVKGYEYEKDQYVLMNEQDFKAANPKATQTIDIEDFVDLVDVDPLLFEKPYYLVPQKGGSKGYMLLRDALKHQGKVAIATIVIRTKQHLVALLPRGNYLILEIIRFAHEIIQTSEAEFLTASELKKTYNDRELKMAERLIEDMSSKWKPEKYKDTYFDDLMKRIKTKIKQGKGHTIVREDEEGDEIQPSNVRDLLPLLRKSLERGKSASKPSKRSSSKRLKAG